MEIRRYRDWWVGALASFAVLFAGGCRGSGGRGRDPHVVRITGMAFVPQTLTVQRGDMVEFLNSDLVPHTVTAQRPDQFDSGAIIPEKTWRYHADRTGEFSYRCTLHPSMTGTIKVVDETKPALAASGRAVEWCVSVEPLPAPRSRLLIFPLPGISDFSR